MNEFFSKRKVNHILNKVNYSNLGISRVKYVADKLELTNSFKVIHIAGTNGKGSVAHYLFAGISACEKKVGLFVSPITTTFLNCFQSSVKQIIYNDLFAATKILSPFLKEFKKQKNRLTRFEIEFLLALIVFKKQNIEYIIIECGMGGRDDATNIFPYKICNCFTSISIDHAPLLGNNIYEILENKVDIINPCDPLNIFYPMEKNILDHLTNYLLTKNITNLKVIPNLKDYSVYYQNKLYTPKMNGSFQKLNFYLAAQVFRLLINKQNLPLDYEKCLQSAVKVKLPLRLEKIQDNILIDGCHNVDACQHLINYLQTSNYLTANTLIIFGAYKDKDVIGMLKILKTVSNNFLPITISTNKHRSLNKQEFSSIFNKLNIVYLPVIKDTKVKQFISNNTKYWDNFIICGSLAMTKTIRNCLLKQKGSTK